MSSAKERLYTIDDILAFPEDRRAELIDGQVFDLAAPSRVHQAIIANTTTDINNHLRTSKKDCSVYPAPFGVYLDNYNYVEPDITVICDKDKLSDRGCEGAPDWVIEVVSPSSQQLDYLVKLLKYRAAGVRLYWVVNPITQAINVYDFAGAESAQYSFDDEIPVAICDGFGIRFSEDVDYIAKLEHSFSQAERGELITKSLNDLKAMEL